jgi:hypothetical protein
MPSIRKYRSEGRLSAERDFETEHHSHVHVPTVTIHGYTLPSQSKMVNDIPNEQALCLWMATYSGGGPPPKRPEHLIFLKCVDELRMLYHRIGVANVWSDVEGWNIFRSEQWRGALQNSTPRRITLM